jgi:hypothetical protein
MKDLNNALTEAIKTAKLEYLSDISWTYESVINPNCISIQFWQSGSGKNDVSEFCVKVNGIWMDIVPTDEQLKLMYDKLNNTPYRKTLEEINEIEVDQYEEYGVKQSDFY